MLTEDGSFPSETNKKEQSLGYKLGECQLEHPYRYSLVADTDCRSENHLIVIQCNPSVATNKGSDPTVGKVAIWAEALGFGRVIFLNLFALISSQPSALAGKSFEHIVGPRNDEILFNQLKSKNCTVVLAWGGSIPIKAEYYKRRLVEIKKHIEDAGHIAHHIGALSHGIYPRHGRMWNKGNRDLWTLDWGKLA